MNPKPLVALNHFTVPLAITSSPRDQKIITNGRSPQNRHARRGARYAVWGTLDSLNDIGICGENAIIAAHLPFLPISRSFEVAKRRQPRPVPIYSQFIYRGEHLRPRHADARRASAWT